MQSVKRTPVGEGIADGAPVGVDDDSFSFDGEALAAVGTEDVGLQQLAQFVR